MCFFFRGCMFSQGWYAKDLSVYSFGSLASYAAAVSEDSRWAEAVEGAHNFFWGKGYLNSACGLFQRFGRSHIKLWSSWKAGRSELTRIDLEMDRTHLRQTWQKTKISKFVGDLGCSPFSQWRYFGWFQKTTEISIVIGPPNTIENHWNAGFKPICFYKLMCMKR